MKQYYSCLVCILVSINLYAQNDLIGEWYLDYVVVDNVTHTNYFNENQDMDIVFTSNPSGPTTYDYTGNSSCNFYSGPYSADGSSITLNDLNITLIDCGPIPLTAYEIIYLDVLSNGQASGPINLTYNISGAGEDAILTITNSNNDSAVYVKSPTTTLLVTTWYLHHINIPGNPTIVIPNSVSPTLELTNDIDPIFFDTQANGFGECNVFNTNYDVGINPDGDFTIQFSQFFATLNDTDCIYGYEYTYFNTLQNTATNYMIGEISNNGTTLTLTDLLGVSLIYGDGALSNADYQSRNFSFAISKNPTNNILNVTSEQDTHHAYTFKIFDLQGKLMHDGALNSEDIMIDNLNSGMYFLKISNDFGQFQILKFIKH